MMGFYRIWSNLKLNVERDFADKPTRQCLKTHYSNIPTFQLGRNPELKFGRIV
jgi:hypothetical protein